MTIPLFMEMANDEIRLSKRTLEEIDIENGIRNQCTDCYWKDDIWLVMLGSFPENYPVSILSIIISYFADTINIFSNARGANKTLTYVKDVQATTSLGRVLTISVPVLPRNPIGKITRLRRNDHPTENKTSVSALVKAEYDWVLSMAKTYRKRSLSKEDHDFLNDVLAGSTFDELLKIKSAELIQIPPSDVPDCTYDAFEQGQKHGFNAGYKQGLTKGLCDGSVVGVDLVYRYYNPQSSSQNSEYHTEQKNSDSDSDSDGDSDRDPYSPTSSTYNPTSPKYNPNSPPYLYT
jgi:hypothetical protein